MESKPEKKPRSNLHLERFKKGLWDWYKITYEELIEKYTYCGGDSHEHYNYWITLFGSMPCPNKQDECVCGVEIVENCFVMDETRTNFIHMGNHCIKKFMPENKSGRTCEICQQSHKNRKYNLCNNCKISNKKCKTCDEYFEFENKRHELCHECYEEKIEKEQEESRRKREESKKKHEELEREREESKRKHEELEREDKRLKEEMKLRAKEIREKSVKTQKGFINGGQTATKVKQIKKCTECDENYETYNVLEIECICNACKIIKQEQINKEMQENLQENIRRNQQFGLMCYCNLSTALRQVSKDNSNKGKLFYCCPKNCNNETKCKYFMWKDESLKRINKNFDETKNDETSTNESKDSDEESKPKCKCNLTAILQKTKKEGPNKGKWFYTCPKYYEQKCKYFMWK